MLFLHFYYLQLCVSNLNTFVMAWAGLGTIPVEIGAMTALESLLIYGNDITGALPESLCSLPLLRTLQVDCLKIDCPATCNCICKDPTEKDPEEVIPATATPTIAQIDAGTPAPTVDGYLFGMPEFSLTALTNPVSPQANAYEWLSGHPAIGSMPEWRMQQLFALGKSIAIEVPRILSC